jgi:hypothetical protein
VRRHGNRNLVLLALAALLFAACSIAGFVTRDPEIERGISALEAKVDTFFTTLESGAGTSAAAFEAHQPFYSDVRTEIVALELRVAHQRRPSSATASALEALKENLERLESLHRTGISAAEVPVLRGLFETQFQTLHRLEGSQKHGKEN